MFDGSGSYQVIFSDGCLFFLHNVNPGYFSWFFLAKSYEITKSITVLKNLKGHSFRKLSTKLSFCAVSIELARKLGASQHLSFLIFST